jgi:dihydroneopterin aldolase
MPDRITLTGLRATGFHGVFEHERRDGQEFIVDVVVEFDVRQAAVTDEVTHTVNYAEVAELVEAHITGEPVNLIETLAERIAMNMLGLALVEAVEVTVHKPTAPIPSTFADVSVSIRRERS